MKDKFVLSDGSIVEEHLEPIGRHTFRPEFDENIILPSHYGWPSFSYSPVTIWGHREAGLIYDYSERLIQWDQAKAKAAEEQATAKFGETFTPKRIQFYLSEYHGKPVVLRHIMAGVVDSRPYFVYGYSCDNNKNSRVES